MEVLAIPNHHHPMVGAAYHGTVWYYLNMIGSPLIAFLYLPVQAIVFDQFNHWDPGVFAQSAIIWLTSIYGCLLLIPDENF